MVELNNVNFKYKNKKPLFTDLNLQLGTGFIYGLLGKNGAGKSTLLKHIAGLLYPQSGQCKVFGYTASQRIPQMLEDIYVIPEEFELPSIALNAYTKSNAVFYAKFSYEQFNKYLTEFELPADAKLSTLSYGQKKKFLIAFGLATNARVLILDEPTNGLDIPSKSQFRKIVASALTEDKIIIISTHQVRDLENLIDFVVVLENGKIIFNKNIAEISERLAFEHSLAGVPASDILYHEDMPGRKAGITRNRSGQETRVDLELLFNGVIKDTSVINSHFVK
ncbi:ABC transporter ATP-binding protein [Rhodocytophaga aerolata]|uniref:ABC transporter ATP-binding protein n=1 Tax=Rhodocytophaga aerolata TaxID=455078 RepID=A0ABT8R913_9BACT|nr:ABC transporter ATP-binding protein [Rhodocytophaga aerolata]MDO1448578.1 ABC transporter ATP-binding protein [Rhodocytophaga aerolata]